MERERVAEAKEEAKKASTKRTTKQPEQMLLENYLESRVEDSSKKSRSAPAVSPDHVLTRSKRSKQSSDQSGSIFDRTQLPKPQNCNFYSKLEVVKVIEDAIAAAPESPPTQLSIIKAIVAASYVPVQHRALEKLMKRHNNKEVIVDSEWSSSQGGRAKLLPKEVVDKTAAKILCSGNEGSDLRGTVKNYHQNPMQMQKMSAGCGVVVERTGKATGWRIA